MALPATTQTTTQKVETFFNTALYTDKSNGEPIVTMGHLLMAVLGMVALYLFIPEKKRINLFK